MPASEIIDYVANRWSERVMYERLSMYLDSLLLKLEFIRIYPGMTEVKGNF